MMKNTLVVGGGLNKPSSIVTKLAKELDAVCCNGYSIRDISCHDLVIWMPDIPNNKTKNYPVKNEGAVLICSKVMRKGYTRADAVSRIFKMHANAVICIYKDDPKKVEFELIDALGNTWFSRSSGIDRLAVDIMRLYDWSKSQIRVGFARLEEDQWYDDYITAKLDEKFIDLNTKVADKVENSLGARYFGNFSTRCMKLFPSQRANKMFLFSPRNVDKRRITPQDFVVVMPPYYLDPQQKNRKYSVDAPVQIALYQQFPEINYMIHGHAFVHYLSDPTMTPWKFDHRIAANFTDHYYPCGDLREVTEVAKQFKRIRTSVPKNPVDGGMVVNLRGHGFLLAAKTLSQMETLINKLDFEVSDLLK